MAKRLVMALLGTMGAGAPLAVFAAPPMAYDQWSVNNGTISAQCVGGVACGGGVSGPGMLQRPVDNGTAKFIQSIMTNPNATGTPATLSFASESFVKQGWTSSDTVNGGTVSSAQSDTGGGIALKQRMVETGSSFQGAFNLTTLIHTGWADDNSTPTIEINQHNGSNLAVVQWSNDFVYKQNVNAAGTVTGLSMDIDQLGINLRNFDPIKAQENHPNDVMHYVRRRRAGDMNPGRLGGVSGGGGGSSVPAFTAGGDAQVTWFGMYYYGEPGPNTSIGYQAYDDLSDTRAGSSQMEKEDAPGRPWSWDNMFGIIPTMPFPPPGGKSN